MEFIEITDKDYLSCEITDADYKKAPRETTRRLLEDEAGSLAAKIADGNCFVAANIENLLVPKELH